MGHWTSELKIRSSIPDPGKEEGGLFSCFTS